MGRTSRTTSSSLARRALYILFSLLLAGPGCTPSHIVGPLSHSEDEREHLLTRAQVAGVSGDIVGRAFPPLTAEELDQAREQDSSCRSSYMWKNALTWTGSILIAVAAGITIGSAYATGNSDNTSKIAFGVSVGTLATFGAGLVAIGGIIGNGFTDRGCVSKISFK
jgi:hypothetical protein